IEERMVERANHLAATHGSRISLVGWSLGGIFARQIARDIPDAIRQVVTMGSPFGSAGQGTTHHLGIELLGNRTGSKFLHVPYRGDAPLITALLAGEVQFGLATPTLILENIKAGRLRALATTANERAAMLSDVPTVEQALQIQNYDVRTWFGMAGPAGLPAGVVTRLNGELGKGLASPEVRARLAGIGGEVAATTPAQMRDRVARELQTWTETVNQAGIEKQ
ncbi:MAG: tripartite tricarboxylate transporter substrate-binding protein, partial [Hyphomicrobiales bacterium]